MATRADEPQGYDYTTWHASALVPVPASSWCVARSQGRNLTRTQSYPTTDPKVNTLLATIQSERRNLEGAKAVMRAVEASSRNEAVIQQARNEVRSAQASIKFLEDELAKIQLGTPGGSPAGPSPRIDPRDRPLPPPPGQESQYMSPAQQTPPRPAPQPGGLVREGTVAQKNFTQLGQYRIHPLPRLTCPDLMRYDAPLSGAKITRMLNQLQFKLQVEEQYKLGIEKMAQAYKVEGDRRLKSETDSKRAESDGKIQLLRKALRRYETLGKFGGAQEEDGTIQGSSHADVQTCCMMASGKTPSASRSQAS